MHSPGPAHVSALLAVHVCIFYAETCDLACWRCGSSYSKRDPAVRDWLKGSCVPQAESIERPCNRVVDAPLHIGNHNIHSTHMVRHYKGFIYCKKCGCRASSKMKLLARPCEPPSKYGKATLKALANNRLPPHLHAWPTPY